MQANLNPPNTILIPIEGVDSSDVNRSLSQLQDLSAKLLKERDELKGQLAHLQAQNHEMTLFLTALQEKVQCYRPIIRQWGRDLITPEEVEQIMKDGEWVNFEEVMKEVQEVADEP